MKSFNLVLIAALVLTACETRYVAVGDDLPDAVSDTLPDGIVELCSDGLDNDFDGLVDCQDNDGDENCPPCADASTDTITDDGSSIEADVPPVELCSDGVDNDFDGLVDCNDENDCCDEAVCATSEHCASEDASSDSEEETDVVSDTGADSDPAEDPVPDTDPDSASDVVDAEADVADILHTGLATFKWCRPMTMLRPDHILAECFVWGSLYDSWDDSWELATGSPDFVAPADSDCIEFTLPDLDYTLLGVNAECNITAYYDSAYGPWGRIYALGECTCGGSCVVKGTLIVRSGPDADDATALDLTSLVVQSPRCASLSDQAGNYVLSPIP